MSFNSRIILLVCFLFTATHLAAQHNLTVNVASVLNDVSKKPIGMNVNHLMDDAYIFPAPATSTAAALQGMGVKFLRYPGGEKADNYLWSLPPYTQPNPHFARTGYCDWPSGDTRFAESDYATVKEAGLDFDEFMTMCQSLGAEPVIVVPYDAMYKPSGCNGTVPAKAELLTNAEEWVRYANITKGYNIKYWMVGNESYKTDSYNGFATASQYRDDVIEFSQRMKAIDPSIKIIANGDGNAWWATVLPTAAAHIDFIGVSNYPVWNFTGGYTYYKNNIPDLMGVVNNTINAINSYAPASEQNRLKVITTEFNANDWSGSWADVNDMGHALAAFEIAGKHLENPKVEAALMWNTRWVDNTTQPNHIYDALKSNGSMNANGMAMSIWGNSLLDKMVAATGTTKVRTYASYRASTNELNVFIVNKETTAQTANLTIANYISNAPGVKWEMKGSGPADTAPVWAGAGNVALAGNSISLPVPAASITLLKFMPVTPLPVELVTLTYLAEPKYITLNWLTASETNNKHFTIERSKDGSDFSAAGIVDGAGTVSHSTAYTFTDRNPFEGTSYYRLKQTDHDGTFTYSDVLAVNLEPSNSRLNIYPNPADRVVKIEFDAGKFEQVKLKAFSADGKDIYSASHPALDGATEVNVATWPRGVYFVRVQLGEKVYNEKLVVQ